jgi:hypothetical protein
MVAWWVTTKAESLEIYWKRWPTCGPFGTAARSRICPPELCSHYLHCLLAVASAFLSVLFAVAQGEGGHLLCHFSCCGDGIDEAAGLRFDLEHDFDEIFLLFVFVLCEVDQSGGLCLRHYSREEHQGQCPMDIPHQI